MEILITCVLCVCVIFFIGKILTSDNTTSDSKQNHEESKLLTTSDEIINSSKELIDKYNDIQQKWDELPAEPDQGDELAHTREGINIDRKIRETINQIKNKNYECKRWLEKFELLNKISKLSSTAIGQHNTIALIRNDLIDIIIKYEDKERIVRGILTDPKLGYEPYNPAYLMNLNWNEIVTKYNNIILQNDEIRDIIQHMPTSLKDFSKQLKKEPDNKSQAAFYISATILNTINNAVDAAYELDLLKPQCYYLCNQISTTDEHSTDYKSTSQKLDMLAKLKSIIKFAEMHTDDFRKLSCNTRKEFFEEFNYKNEFLKKYNYKKEADFAVAKSKEPNDGSALIQPEHKKTTDTNQLNKQYKGNEEHVPGSQKLDTLTSSLVSSKHNDTSFNDDSNELVTERNSIENILESSTHCSSSTTQSAVNRSLASTQNAHQEPQQESQEAVVSVEDITAIRNAITQLQQQMDTLTTLLAQSNTQICSQTNNSVDTNAQAKKTNNQTTNIKNKLSLSEEKDLTSTIEEAQSNIDEAEYIKENLHNLQKQNEELIVTDDNIKSTEDLFKRWDMQLQTFLTIYEFSVNLAGTCLMAGNFTNYINDAIVDKKLSKVQQNKVTRVLSELSDLYNSKEKYSKITDIAFDSYTSSVDNYVEYIDNYINTVDTQCEPIYKNNKNMLNVSTYTTEHNFEITNIINRIIKDLCVKIDLNYEENDNDCFETWSKNPAYILDFCKTITTRVYMAKTTIELLIKKSDLLNDKYINLDINQPESIEAKSNILISLNKALTDLDNLKKLNEIGLEMNEKVYDFVNGWWPEEDNDSTNLELMDIVNELYDINKYIVKYIPQTKGRINSRIENIKLMSSLDNSFKLMIKEQGLEYKLKQ